MDKKGCCMFTEYNKNNSYVNTDNASALCTSFAPPAPFSLHPPANSCIIHLSGHVPGSQADFERMEE